MERFPVLKSPNQRVPAQSRWNPTLAISVSQIFYLAGLCGDSTVGKRLTNFEMYVPEHLEQTNNWVLQ
jgi:hypothetical protein